MRRSSTCRCLLRQCRHHGRPQATIRQDQRAAGCSSSGRGGATPPAPAARGPPAGWSAGFQPAFGVGVAGQAGWKPALRSARGPPARFGLSHGSNAPAALDLAACSSAPNGQDVRAPAAVSRLERRLATDFRDGVSGQAGWKPALRPQAAHFAGKRSRCHCVGKGGLENWSQVHRPSCTHSRPLVQPEKLLYKR